MYMYILMTLFTVLEKYSFDIENILKFNQFFYEQISVNLGYFVHSNENWDLLMNNDNCKLPAEMEYHKLLESFHKILVILYCQE